MTATTHLRAGARERLGSWEYRPQLDGLRCVAIYLVLFFHSRADSVIGGFIGVDLFFVLSGFLVTSVILAEIEERGGFSLGGFYARRVRRLLPAAVLVIVVTSLLQLLITSEPHRLSMVSDARSALLYFANWQFIHDANDYFVNQEGSGIEGSPFLHFWSLSIEEQFYVGYPLLVFVILTRLSWSRRRLAVVLAALTVVSMAWQVQAAGSDVNYAYYATQTRIYQPLIGCVVALALWECGRRPAERTPRSDVLVSALGTVGVLGVLVLASGLLDLSQSVRGLLCAGAAAAAIGGVVLAPKTPVSRLLSLPWPRYLGQISYGTYMWHWPVIMVLDRVFTVRPFVLAVVAGTVATGLAALSSHLIETPIRRAKPLGAVPWPVVGAGLALSVVVAVAVVPNVLESSRRPALRAPAGSVTSTLPPGLKSLAGRVPADIDYQRQVNDRGDTGASCDAGPSSCVVVDAAADRPHIVLVGDSHAGMLTAAFMRLAEEHEFRLSTAIVNRCAWQQGLVVSAGSTAVREQCAQQRTSLYEEFLPVMDADVVVLVTRARSDGHGEVLATADDADEYPDETHQQMMQRKTTETVALIRDAGPRVAIVHSVFGTGGYDDAGFDPLDCLATAHDLADCAVIPPAVQPTVDAVYTSVALTVPDVHTVDLRPAYCPAGPICSPVVNGVVTWHDALHLSTDLVLSRIDEIWTALQKSGCLDELDFDR